MQIRADQLRVFQPIAESAFDQRVINYLRQNHADVLVRLPDRSLTIADASEDILRKLVSSGIRRARAYGISWESNLTAFVVLMFVAAPNFDSYPNIRQVLDNQMTHPELRIDDLWEQTSEEDWEAAEQGYEVNAWESVLPEHHI